MCMQKGELLRIGTIFLGLLFVVLRITNTCLLYTSDAADD